MKYTDFEKNLIEGMNNPKESYTAYALIMGFSKQKVSAETPQEYAEMVSEILNIDSFNITIPESHPYVAPLKEGEVRPLQKCGSCGGGKVL